MKKGRQGKDYQSDMKGADNPFLLLNCFGMVTGAKISVFVQGIRTLQDDFLQVFTLEKVRLKNVDFY